MSVFDLPADGFDRRRPRYRVFNIDGEKQWWTVIAAYNAPGRRCTAGEAKACEDFVAAHVWADHFWNCYAAAGKATIYASIP